MAAGKQGRILRVCKVCGAHPAKLNMMQGQIQGRAIGTIAPLFLQFGKQHSLYKAILLPIVLSQQCCEVYFILFTVAKPL